MRAQLAGLGLCIAISLPALAQITPAQTNLDPGAGRLEARNAKAAARELGTVTPEQALANALKRRDGLPAFYRSDCEARVRGGGQVSGSVLGGGLLKESVTTLPAATLEDEIRAIPPLRLPPSAR